MQHRQTYLVAEIQGAKHTPKVYTLEDGGRRRDTILKALLRNSNIGRINIRFHFVKGRLLSYFFNRGYGVIGCQGNNIQRINPPVHKLPLPIQNESVISIQPHRHDRLQSQVCGL